MVDIWIPTVKRGVSGNGGMCPRYELTGPGWVSGLKQDEAIAQGERHTCSDIVVST